MLEKGSVQRIEGGQRDPRIVTFDRYAVRSVEIHQRPAERDLQHAREVPLGAHLAVAQRPAPHGAGRRIPLGTARSLCHAALPAGICDPGLCLSWAAANDQAKPDAVAARADRRGGAAAAHRLSQRHPRRAQSRRHRCCNTSRSFGSMAAGLWQISRGQAIEPAAAVSKIATIDQRTVCKSDGELRDRPMIAGTLSRYFGFRFLKSRRRLVLRRGRARRDDRLRRAVAAQLGLAESDRPDPRRDFRVPRAATFRTHHAVRGAGRRDVLLSGAVAPARTGRRARGRGFRMAIRRAVDGRARFLFGLVATTIYNPLAAVMHERSKRLESEMMGELPASAAQRRQRRLLGAPARAPTARPSSTPNRAASKAPGSAASASSPSTATASSSSASRRNSATLEQGYWRFDDARIYASGKPPRHLRTPIGSPPT